jgi:hypothetical protein
MKMENKDYQKAYEVSEKIMITLRERNYNLALENLSLKKRLEIYEPAENPKETEFMEAMGKLMEIKGV